MKLATPLNFSIINLFLFTIFFYYYGPRGINLILFILNIILITYFFINKYFEITKKYAFFLLIILSTTLINYYYNETFSLWQIIRSHVWMPLSLLILISAKNLKSSEEKFFNINHICEFIKYYSLGILILFLFEKAFKINLSPNIFFYNENFFFKRYAYPLIESLLIFIPILIKKNYKKTVLILIFLSLISLTKIIFFLVIYILLISLFLFKKDLTSLKFVKKLIILKILIFFYFLFFFEDFFLERFNNLIYYTSSTRYQQIIDFNEFFFNNNQSIIKIIFGNGLGSAYRSIDISGIYDPPTLRAYINYQYDIENGFFAILFLSGLFGLLLYFLIAINSFNKYKLILILYLIISYIGTGAIGLGQFYKMFLLGLALNYFTTLSHETNK